MKGKFFYNYNAVKIGECDKFNYGIITVSCDDSKCIEDEAFEELKKEAKKLYPAADGINITAFNAV